MSLKIHKLHDELNTIETTFSWLRKRKITLKLQINDLAQAEIQRGDVFASQKDLAKLFIVTGTEKQQNAELLYIEGIIVNQYQPYDIILEQYDTSVELEHLLVTHKKLEWKASDEVFEQLKKSQAVIDVAKKAFEKEMKVLCSIQNNFRMG